MPEAGVGWLVIHFYSIECHGPNTLDERSPKQISTIKLSIVFLPTFLSVNMLATLKNGGQFVLDILQ
ncbi:hypothetical protein BLOT_005852 [Blomia tropicalis]|nr:hypothetical protein BLOT_005852 [Blomia tropicalis]